jgi:hypothetical protein
LLLCPSFHFICFLLFSTLNKPFILCSRQTFWQWDFLLRRLPSTEAFAVGLLLPC